MMMKNRTKEALLDRMVEMNAENNLNKENKALAVTLFKNAQKIGNKIYLEIPVNMMKVDTEMYQRPIMKHARAIARNWDENKCDAIKVNYRNDGYFYVIDGQHRREACIMRGIDTLICVVYVGLTVKEEAEIFVDGNTNSSKPNPHDTFKANICRGEETDTIIKDVCDKHNVKVEKKMNKNHLQSVTVARDIVRQYGRECLEWVFEVIEKSDWNIYYQAYSYQFMNAFKVLYNQNKNNLKELENNLVDFLKHNNPEDVSATAIISYRDMSRNERLVKLFTDMCKENGKVVKPVFGMAKAQ